VSGRAADLRVHAGQALLVVAVALLCGEAYRLFLVHPPALHADEAGHALPAARMAFALRALHPGAFLAATRREVVWPFVHPWVLSAFFLTFGVSAQVARVSSLVTFAAALALVPVLAREIAPRRDGPAEKPLSAEVPLLGWISVATLAGATSWAGVCAVMTEPLGLLLTLAVLLVEARAARGPGLAGHAAAGFLTAAAFLTKYSYGLPLIAALALAYAARARRGQVRPARAALAGLCLPVVLWAAWIFLPDPLRLGDLRAAFVNRDEGLHGLAGFLFYPRAIVRSVGAPMALAVVFLWMGLRTRGRWGRRGTAVLFVVIALAMLTVHPNKQERYLFAVLPVALILAETELARMLARLPRRNVLWAAAAILLLVIHDPRVRLREAARDSAKLNEARPILAYVAETVAGRQPVLFLGTTGLLPHLALTWELLERQSAEPAVQMLFFPDRGSWAGRHRSGYATEMGPEYDRALRAALDPGRYGSVVTLALGKRSPFLPDWLAKWDAWGQNYVRMMSDPRTAEPYVLDSERAFPASDAQVRIFVLRPDPAQAPGRAN
jgi:4-amino-4-deoxy-L-arabinose transferase-like glycosyltransferase